MKNFSALGSANIIFDNNFGNNFLATVSGFNPRTFSANSLKQREIFMTESKVVIVRISMKVKR